MRADGGFACSMSEAEVIVDVRDAKAAGIGCSELKLASSEARARSEEAISGTPDLAPGGSAAESASDAFRIEEFALNTRRERDVRLSGA